MKYSRTSDLIGAGPFQLDEYLTHRHGGVLLKAFRKSLAVLIPFLPEWHLRAFFYRVVGINVQGWPYIGNYCLFDDVVPELITIEDGVGISMGVTIVAHDTHRGIAAAVTVKQKAFLGVRSIILPGVTVGEDAVVAAGSLVMKDVPPGATVFGVPARIVPG